MGRVRGRGSGGGERKPLPGQCGLRRDRTVAEGGGPWGPEGPRVTYPLSKATFQSGYLEVEEAGGEEEREVGGRGQRGGTKPESEGMNEPIGVSAVGCRPYVWICDRKWLLELAGFQGWCIAQWQGVPFTHTLRSGPEGPEGGGGSWSQAALGLPLASSIGQNT